MACDVPGRDRDLACLLAQLEAIVAEEGGGRTVFVVGGEGSGRGALLRGFVDELARVKRRPVVVAGSFRDGSYVAWDGEPRPTARVVSVLKRIVSAGESVAALLDGLLPLLGQWLSRSRPALQLVESLVTERGRPDISVLMPRVLRALCEEGPVVCVVDDADQAQWGWWGDLVLLFARRVARELPLLLVLAVDGPPQLGAHEDDEPDALFVARELTADGLASWHHLTAVTAGLERAGGTWNRSLRAPGRCSFPRGDFASQGGPPIATVATASEPYELAVAGGTSTRRGDLRSRVNSVDVAVL